MVQEQTSFFLDRHQAARQLASMLNQFRGKRVVIVAVSDGGVPIAKLLSQELNAEIAFVPSRILYSPADPNVEIGVVSLDTAIVKEGCRDIPQDYIYRQVQQMRNSLLADYSDFHDNMVPEVEGKVVILVDDITKSSYEILASMKTVMKQRPEKVVVACPVVTIAAACEIADQAEAVFLHVVSADEIGNSFMVE